MKKVVFKKMDLQDNIDLVKLSYFDKDEILNLHECTINLFPKLKNINKNCKKEDIDRLIEEVVTEEYRKKEDLLTKNVDKYQKLWDKYNDSFLKILSMYLNVSLPNKDIVATVGIIPVCPRYLDEFSFSVHDDIPDNILIETCAHELCHFLWFQKWKKLYPNYNKDDFESPSKIWEYSEMVVDPILNSEEFVSLFGKKTRYAYDYFYEKDGLMDGLFNIYSQDIPIEKKIIKGFQYIKKIKNT